MKTLIPTILLMALIYSNGFCQKAKSNAEIEALDKNGLREYAIQITKSYNDSLAKIKELKKNDDDCTDSIAKKDYQLGLQTNHILINGLYWKKKSERIKTYFNDSSMIEAKSIDEWKSLTDDSIPCYLEREYRSIKEEDPLFKEDGYLYNYYAIKKFESWKGVASYRLPTKEDAYELSKYLLEISQNAENTGVLLRPEFSLNVKKGGFCYEDTKWDSKRTVFWLNPEKEPLVYGISLDNVTNKVDVLVRTSLYYGYMVRLVKK